MPKMDKTINKKNSWGV